MTILSVDDLGLSFGTDIILEHISFSLDEADKLGVIGVNGSGKSSLFRMITGTYEPTEGKVYISKDKTVGILTQDGAFEREGDGTALSLMYHAFPHLLAACFSRCPGAFLSYHRNTRCTCSPISDLRR